MRVVKSFIGYNKRLGILGFGAMLAWAVLAFFAMWFLFVGLNSDGQLSGDHVSIYPARAVVAWVFCLPFMAMYQLPHDSWLHSSFGVVFVLAFNFLVPYLVLWPVHEVKLAWQNRRSRWIDNSSTAQ